MPHGLPGTQASQIVVIGGAGYDAKKRADNSVLATETDPGRIAEVCSLLARQGPGERFDWMEWPTVSFVLLNGRTVLAEYGLLSGAEWVREGDAGDYAVADPEGVREWLSAVSNCRRRRLTTVRF